MTSAGITAVANWSSGREYLNWNAVMAGVRDDALNPAVFEPSRQCFPALRCSNYGSGIVDETNAVPDVNGHWQWAEAIPTGAHQAPSCYAGIGQLARKSLDGVNPLGQSAFAACWKWFARRWGRRDWRSATNHTFIRRGTDRVVERCRALDR